MLGSAGRRAAFLLEFFSERLEQLHLSGYLGKCGKSKLNKEKAEAQASNEFMWQGDGGEWCVKLDLFVCRKIAAAFPL